MTKSSNQDIIEMLLSMNQKDNQSKSSKSTKRRGLPKSKQLDSMIESSKRESDKGLESYLDQFDSGDDFQDIANSIYAWISQMEEEQGEKSKSSEEIDEMGESRKFKFMMEEPVSQSGEGDLDKLISLLFADESGNRLSDFGVRVICDESLLESLCRQVVGISFEDCPSWFVELVSRHIRRLKAIGVGGGTDESFDDSKPVEDKYRASRGIDEMDEDHMDEDWVNGHFQSFVDHILSMGIDDDSSTCECHSDSSCKASNLSSKRFYRLSDTIVPLMLLNVLKRELDNDSTRRVVLINYSNLEWI